MAAMAATQGRVCLGLTDAGKVIWRGTVFIALAALIVPAFGVLSVLVSVMLMSLVVGFLLRPRILVTGRLPERVIAGQTAHLTYTLKNVGRLPAYDLQVRFPALPEAIEQTGDPQVISRLGPGRDAEVTVTIRPKRRGRYQIKLPICESSFPFNLLRFGRSREGQESMIVLPPLSLLQISLPYLSRHVDTISLRPASRTGTSPEYIGSRPFQSGDSPRRIDVRAWARLSVPATKEYDNDLDNYAALVLDTRVPHGRLTPKQPEAGELEAAVSLCASMAYTIHNDCLIDLLLAGADLHPLASLPKSLRLDRIHETLATVASSAGYTAEQVGPLLEDRLEELSEIVFILLAWDRTYQPLVELAERAGCHCTVIVVGTPDGGGRGDRDPKRDLSAFGNPTLWSPERGRAGTGACPYGDIRYVSAEEILAGRSVPL
jgi:uncharacterized protein (DUF58 family)